MTQRTVEDRLREEYFELGSDIKRVLCELQTAVAFLLLPMTLKLKHHERIQIESRVKDCESAINSLRRREEALEFDEDAWERYTLTSLPDLAALRVLVFPRSYVADVNSIVREQFHQWTCDPVRTGNPPVFRAWKYHGFCATSAKVQAEIQVVPMLTGLFWRVEHGAFYKPRDEVLRGVANKAVMRERTGRVYEAFDALEETLERELEKNVRLHGLTQDSRAPN